MLIMTLIMTSPTGTVLQTEDAMKGDQAFLSRLEEGMLATKLQAIKDREVRWVQPGRMT
jgi:hypothetical protein